MTKKPIQFNLQHASHNSQTLNLSSIYRDSLPIIKLPNYQIIILGGYFTARLKFSPAAAIFSAVGAIPCGCPCAGRKKCQHRAQSIQVHLSELSSPQSIAPPRSLFNSQISILNSQFLIFLFSSVSSVLFSSVTSVLNLSFETLY
jgi:hypothetical protein